VYHSCHLSVFWKRKRKKGKKLTLKIFGSVKSLLLLQEMDITHKRDATNVLAVKRIRQGDAFVVGEICAVVFAKTSLNHARYFCYNVGRAFVVGHVVSNTRASHFTLFGTLEASSDRFQRVLERIHLIAVGRHDGQLGCKRGRNVHLESSRIGMPWTPLKSRAQLFATPLNSWVT
jgi:hypothetical protein